MCVSGTRGKFQGSFQAGKSSSCLLALPPPRPLQVALSSRGAGCWAWGALVPSAHLPPRAFLPAALASLLLSSLHLGRRRAAPAGRVLGYGEPHKTARSTCPRLPGGLCLLPGRRGAGRVCTGCRRPCSTNAAEKTGELGRQPRPRRAAGRARGLLLACRNVSASFCPLLRPWDSHTCLGRSHGVQEAALSFPTAWPQPGQSRQRPGPRGSRASMSVSWPQKQMEQPFCRALELSARPGGRCSWALLSCPTHLKALQTQS